MGTGKQGHVFGTRDSRMRVLGCRDACMGGHGDAGTRGREDMGTRGRGEVTNKRNHSLLQKGR